jgi:hypothetical protein
MFLFFKQSFTSACFLMAYGKVEISKKSFATIMTMSAGCVVLTINADTATFTARQEIKLFVKSTFIRMRITIASYCSMKLYLRKKIIYYLKKKKSIF